MIYSRHALTRLAGAGFLRSERALRSGYIATVLGVGSQAQFRAERGIFVLGPIAFDGEVTCSTETFVPVFSTDGCRSGRWADTIAGGIGRGFRMDERAMPRWSLAWDRLVWERWVLYRAAHEAHCGSVAVWRAVVN